MFGYFLPQRIRWSGAQKIYHAKGAIIHFSWTHSPLERTYIFDRLCGREILYWEWKAISERANVSSVALRVVIVRPSPRIDVDLGASQERRGLGGAEGRGSSTRKNQREREGGGGNRVNECLPPLFSSSPSHSPAVRPGRGAGASSLHCPRIVAPTSKNLFSRNSLSPVVTKFEFDFAVSM